MRWLKLLAIGVMTASLAGCVSDNFDTSTDLSGAVPKVTPIDEGRYQSTDDTGSLSDFGTFTLDKGRSYKLVTANPDNEGDPDAFGIVSVFGPVNGLYVVQLSDPKKPGAFQNFIAKIAPHKAIQLADDEPVQLALARVEGKGLTTPVATDGKASTLTGSAAENWATISFAIQHDARSFTYGLTLRRVDE